MKTIRYDALPGVHTSPNIQNNYDLYEIENQALDPEGKIEADMQRIASWKDKIILDLGAGTGYYVPRFHTEAQHVFAVEPHDLSRLRIMERAVRSGLTRVSVLSGSAEYIPLRDHSVDIVHARFAYFFAPHCDPGLSELQRVIRPGGTVFIIDNDLRSGKFAEWLRKSYYKDTDPDLVENFWKDRDFILIRIQSEWRFKTRSDLEAVVRLEFGEALAQKLLADHEGLRVQYHYCLYHCQY